MQSPKVPDADKQTIVEEGTLLDGSLVSSCAIVVNGKIRGEVTAPSLRVNGTGSVHGKAKVDRIVSAGELSGNFEADEIKLAGVVRNETILRANSLEVQLAAGDRGMEFGTCSLEVGEMPDKEAAIRAALGLGAANTTPGAPADISSADASRADAPRAETPERAPELVPALETAGATDLLAVEETRSTGKRRTATPARRQ